MSRKNKACKDNPFKLKEKFIFGTAMLGAMVGYGRGAHANCTGAAGT